MTRVRAMTRDGATAPAPAQAGVEAALVELVKILQRLERRRPRRAGDGGGCPAEAPEHDRVRRRRVQAGQELARQRPARPGDLPGRRRPGDVGDHARALRRGGRRRPCARRGDDGTGGRASRSPIDELAELGERGRQPAQREAASSGSRSRVPSPLLKQGLVVVDTPGHGRARRRPRRRDARRSCPFADGLIFVSRRVGRADARRRSTSCAGPPSCARRCCSPRPRSTSTRSGSASSSSTAATSSATGLRAADGRRVERRARRGAGPQGPRRSTSAAASPSSSRQLGDEVVAPAKAARRGALGRRRRGRSRRWCAAGCEAEKAAARRPRRDEGRRSSDLEAAKQRLEHLRGPGARWSTIVGDRIADLSNNVMFEFRGAHARDLAQHGRGDRGPAARATPGTTWSTTSRPTSPTRSPTPSSPSRRAAWRSATRSSRCSATRTSTSTSRPGSDMSWFDVTDLWQGKALDADASAAQEGVRHRASPGSGAPRAAS